MLKHNWLLKLYLVSCLTNKSFSGEGMRSVSFCKLYQNQMWDLYLFTGSLSCSSSSSRFSFLLFLVKLFDAVFQSIWPEVSIKVWQFFGGFQSIIISLSKNVLQKQWQYLAQKMWQSISETCLERPCKKFPFWTARMATWPANNFTSCQSCRLVTHTFILEKITKCSTINLRFVSVKIQSCPQTENYVTFYSNPIFRLDRKQTWLSKNFFGWSSCPTTIQKLFWALTLFHELKLQASTGIHHKDKTKY